MSNHAAGSRVATAFDRATSTSAVWRATTPARRAWMAAEEMVRRDSETRLRDLADERVLATVKASALARAFDRMLDAALAVWRRSITRSLATQLSDRLDRQPVRERAHIAGLLAAAASVTVLIAQRAAPRPEPFAWIIPTLALAIGAGLIVVTLPGRSDR